MFNARGYFPQVENNIKKSPSVGGFKARKYSLNTSGKIRIASNFAKLG